MPALLLFILAEGLLVAHAKYQIKARKYLVKKWLEGSLSEEELKRLKEAAWFQKHILNPKSVDVQKKNN